MRFKPNIYLFNESPLIPCIRTVALLLCCFALACMCANALVYEFPGNNYLYYGQIRHLLWLFFSFLALSYTLGVSVMTYDDAVEYFVYMVFVVIVTFASNAIQYTPFEPIDSAIIALEESLHLSVSASVLWLHQYPGLKHMFAGIYELIGLELLVIPIAAIYLKQYYYLYEFYFLMLVTTLLGFVFYYFFPTTGPASMLHLSFFSDEQIATGLKFREIHHYQSPSTLAGGMIAMPSFHVIWAFLAVYFMRFQPLFCFIVVVFNVFIMLSCVLLGWHYYLDIVGSFMTFALAFGIKKWCGIARD